MNDFISPPLSPGDKAALIAPSSPCRPGELDKAVRSVKFLGLTPVVMPSCKMRCGYLAGSDKQRARDINDAFASKEISCISCIRGGYGSARLLPQIDYPAVRERPKPFIGYSDTTALHTVFNQLCGIVTYHGPMPGIGYHELDVASLRSLTQSLFSPQLPFSLENPGGILLKTLHPGKAAGTLTGGNLTVLASTLGSPYEIDTKDKILFLEDVNEPLYKIDRALTALDLAGKFRDCSGVILGTFTGCEASDGDRPLSLTETVMEIIGKYEKPMISDLQAGHIYPQLTLPMGHPVHIEAAGTGKSRIEID